MFCSSRHLGIPSGQCVNVPDLPGHSHGVAVDDVKVLFPKKKQTLARIEPLNPGTAVHVLDLKKSNNKKDIENKSLEGREYTNLLFLKLEISNFKVRFQTI